MSKLHLTTQTLLLLEAQVLPGHRVVRTAKQGRDGLWALELDDEVGEQIAEFRLAGENDDDVILRVISLVLGSVH